MKHNYFIITSLFLILFFSASSIVQAQTKDTTTPQKVLMHIVKNDNSEYFGYILNDDGRELLVETQTIGRIFINKSDIRSIKVATQYKVNADGTADVDGFINEGPFSTRYYFTTNALPIKKGENYAMIHLYGPEVHFAVSDNLSLGVMTTWIGAPMALAAKYSFDSKKPNTHYALGTIIGNSSYLANASASGGLLWGTVTQGDRLMNISFSAGYAFLNLGKRIGSDYRYPNYQWHSYQWSGSEYYVPYEANNAIVSKLALQGNPLATLVGLKARSSAVIGVAGIAPVGKKANFIFDGMAFIGKDKYAEYYPYKINVTYTDRSGSTVNEDLTIGKGTMVSRNTATVIIMPAMRFNSTQSKAFQVALAGVISFTEGQELSVVPLPMVSWLRQF